MKLAKQQRAALTDRKRLVCRRIEDRWQLEMSPPADRNPHAFEAMCALYPDFAAAARKIGTLK